MSLRSLRQGASSSKCNSDKELTQYLDGCSPSAIQLIQALRHLNTSEVSISISDNHRLHHRRLSVDIGLGSRPGHHILTVSLLTQLISLHYGSAMSDGYPRYSSA